MFMEQLYKAQNLQYFYMNVLYLPLHNKKDQRNFELVTFLKTFIWGKWANKFTYVVSYLTEVEDEVPSTLQDFKA